MRKDGKSCGNAERFLSFGQKIDEKLTKKNQRILSFLSLIAAAIAIFDAVHDIFIASISITIYVLAAIGLACACTLLMKDLQFFISSVLLPFTHSNPIANTLITDNRLRTVLAAVPGMGLNLIYAVLNGVIGAAGRSAWYSFLAVYYLLLCIMRFLAVSYARQVYAKKEETGDLEKRKYKVYQNCGAMLAVMSIALAGAVLMLVLGEDGKAYPGLMIYTAATYTFYKLTLSIVNLLKARKQKSLLLTTLRNISCSDALISLLSLQTALFAAFGQDAGEFVPIMNGITGGAVCLLVLSLGLYMMGDGKNKMARREKENEA